MKLSEIPSRTTIPLPFAINGETIVPNKEIDPLAADSTDRFFTSNYQWNGTTKPSKFITRQLVNKLFGMMSGRQFLYQCGGLETFDNNVCDAIGGYPKGAVLQYLDGNILYDVVSEHDGNTVDYTKFGIDGVNWSFYGSSVFSYVYPDYGTTGVSNLVEIEVAANANGMITNTVGSTTSVVSIIVPFTCYLQAYVSSTTIASSANNFQCGLILYGEETEVPSNVPNAFDGKFTSYEIAEIGSISCPVFSIMGGTRISAFSMMDSGTAPEYSIMLRFLTPTRTR